MSADERRIVALLILEADRQVRVDDIALALSGSFRGVSNEQVAEGGASKNKKLAAKSKVLC